MKMVPKHQKDQKERGHHDEGDLLREHRKKPKAGDLADDPVQHGGRKRKYDGDGHDQNDKIGAAIRLSAHHQIADRA